MKTNVLFFQRGKTNKNNLDISWLRDDNLESGEDLLEPDILPEQIIGSLENALAEMTELIDAI